MNVWLIEIWRSWRASLRKPGFLLLASGVLALGVGSGTAVFTLIEHVLLKPLPYPHAERLVALGPLDGSYVGGISPQQYQQLRGLDGVREMGLYMPGGPAVNISGNGEPQLVPSLQMDRGTLPTLGMQPLLGRNFNREEDSPNGPAVAIISYGLWQRRFNADAAIIGRSLRVEGTPHTIIGVMPADWDLAGDVILPAALRPNSREDGTNYEAAARLQAGATRAAVAAQVDARLRAFYAPQAGTYGEWWKHMHFGAQDLHAFRHAEDGLQLALFAGCALAVLLIAQVNLTSLMLLRALSRRQETAVRGALGASEWRLVLPLLAEALLVGMLGAAAGLGLAGAGLAVLGGLMPPDWMAGGLHPGAPAGVFAGVVGVLGALLGSVLGLRRSHIATAEALREGGRNGWRRQERRFGRWLVMAQVALATVLLCACGLFAHALLDAARVPLGYRTQGIVTFELAPIKATYPDAAAVEHLSRRLVDRLRSIPGVDAASAATNLPGGSWRDQFNLGGFRVPGGRDENNIQFHAVDTGYFRLFGIPLEKGRGFVASDVRGGEAVAIVNRTLADRWYGGHALGQLIQRGEGAERFSARIVGVVADTYQLGPLEPRSRGPILYLPLTQVPDRELGIFRSFEPMRYALAVRGDPAAYRHALQQAVAAVAPNQPMDNVRTMPQIMHATIEKVRVQLWLTALFAGLALLLAAAGLYAVMAVAVASREHEFGVRLALGSPPARLAWLVLRGGARQVAAGLASGIVLALVAGQGLHMLMLVLGLRRDVLDPPVLVVVALALLAAGSLACLLPALRAGRVSPIRALKGE